MKLLKTFFTYTKSQQIGVIALLVLILLLSIIRYSIPYFYSNKIPTTDTAFMNTVKNFQLDTLSANTYKTYTKEPSEEEAVANLCPVNFNPNTIDSNGFIAMGMRPRLIHTILNARRKNWHFYNAQSFEKMYGLYAGEFKKLEPYISIPQEKNSFQHATTNEINTSKPIIANIELNSCDTTSLIQLPMIANKLANNIIKYRSLLGGYAYKEQLKEVFGVQETTYAAVEKYIHVNATAIKKININEADYNKLNSHPYLKGEIATAIANLRKQKNYHFDNLQQLREIELINEQTFRKIAYYLEVK